MTRRSYKEVPQKARQKEVPQKVRSPTTTGRS
ncbi:hypothetical protein J007_01368 [Cryptococcus neoformans]|nr:hypothetical protein C356_01372 [Cryptococcus neoformans var. grubii c45]OXB38923.1 hypothetical protein J007_01368 [Cryptococcus neoformans var. grubii]OXC63548.1 hypothetical protein C358_01371 [Cryptococcus neoformans var. grubii MW-RSA852]